MAKRRRRLRPRWSEVPTHDGPVPLLPRCAGWFYVVAPPLFVFLLHDDAFSWAPMRLLATYAVMLVSTLILGGAFHALYADVVPKLLDGREGRTERGLIHAAALGTALAIGVPLTFGALWLLSPLTGHEPGFARLVFLAGTIGTLLLLPIAAIGELRREARVIAIREQIAEQRALAAQLSALQARVNPHFLFNTLNSLACLIPEDPAAAEQAVLQLASVFRYTLDGSRRASVPLSEELEAVRGYLEVERLRFGDRLRFTEEVDPAALAVVVPPLTVLPLIENAVQHAVGPQRNGATVRLRARRRGTRLTLSVSDDGPGPGNSLRTGSGKSLSDLETRLRALYQGSDQVTFARNESGGFEATLRLDTEGPRLPQKPASAPALSPAPRKGRVFDGKPIPA